MRRRLRDALSILSLVLSLAVLWLWKWFCGW